MKLPLPGLRMIKSAIAVLLCLLIDIPRSGGLPFYSAIAAILCMQPDVTSSVKAGTNRVIGTLIGGTYGLIMLYVLRLLPGANSEALRALIIAFAIIPLMYLTILLKKHAATYITCVVFLSITVSHSASVAPHIFAFSRIIDTLIGIAVSLAINALPFLRNRRADDLTTPGDTL